ncbi:NACHT domain protein [Penicillium riverlandense]|uniref:NACHT domain protein n=1 Tax=Penicillium riverlandense TaxID=1903569 RepID=UPI002548C849|nr:NACHT domain protein [Penicillium riverlandense]KAJ5833009.1 NACHT domain protein [Penicillium riverlandense]
MPGNSRQVSSISAIFDSDSISNSDHHSRRESYMRKKANGVGYSNITSVVQSLHRRSGDELGTTASSKLLDISHASLIEWILLGWAQLFVERLNSFDSAIHDFAGDSYLAAQLSYGYCAMLLELGKENAQALMTSFGFFYSTSSTLVNLLARTELFSVSQEIKEQLILALSDLVTLVASVSTHFHKAIRELTTTSISVNIYDTFPGQIQSFRERCGKIAESMWRHQLAKENIDTDRVSVVQSVRSWLAPEDRVLSHLAENISHLAHEREELTCLWMSSYLTRFLKSPATTLSFSGKPGSGKTVLASVIVDRLQEQIGGVTYNALFIPINARIPAETTPAAIAKTILFQLFEKRIGNIQLLHILGDAYERSRKTTSAADYENILWNALERALAAALKDAKELVIVVDGLDEASCGEATLLKRLTAATNNSTNVKLITLGTEIPPASESVMHVSVNEDRIVEDVSTVVRSNLIHSHSFLELSDLSQETVVDQISEASRGSFLWAKLCTKRVRHEHTPDNLPKAVETIINSKPTIADFVLHTIQSPEVNEDAKYMLLWLATAERPLLLKELVTLASIQTDKYTITDRKLDPLHVLRPLNSLVFLQDGQVYLRHGLIRTAVLDVFSKGKLTQAVKDRHVDFVTRLFIYIKNAVSEHHEPSLTPLDRHDTTVLVSKHPLLDFAVRYWPLHLKQTSVFTTGGEGPTAKEFGKILPFSTTLLLLQNALWQKVSTPTLLSYQTIVMNLCRHLLTTNNVVTLQSIISLALLRRDIHHVSEAIPLFYEVTTGSQTLLTARHIVTMQMARLFLDLTVEQITTTKSDIMAKREIVLWLIVECYKIHYGNTSEQVVTVLKTLVEHYRLIKEEKRVQEIEVTIQSITGSQYSTVDDDAHGDLHVHLNRHEQNGETGVRFVLDVEEDDVRSESFDSEALLKQAQAFVAEGRVTEAECIYVEIWQRASKECRMQHSEHWEQIKLRSVVIYSKFLQSQKREYEASSILSSVWEEYRHTSLSLSQSSASHFQEIASVMSAVGLSAAALSIFKHCAYYYQSTNSTSSSAYSEIQKSITATSQQVMKQASSSSSVVSETTLEEIVFEASSSITKIDQSSFTATHTLAELYSSQHRWKDATRVLKKVLHGLWPSLFAPSVQDVNLPSKHTDKCVDLAERLSQCYHYRRRFLREEGIRVRVYHAVRFSKPVDDRLRERVTTELLKLYERSSQPDMGISTRQEILDDYTKHYGPEHPIVIKTLWTLAELTHPRPISVEYYQRIIRALNKDSPKCQAEAIEPLVIVVTELWNQSRFSDAVPYYSLLFTTFLDDTKKSPRFQNQDFVLEFFTRYTHCLRSVRTEITTLHKITVDYQSKVKTVFGVTASITIKATLALAKVCQESKRYETEVITLYEDLLKIKSDEIDYDEITAILDGIYEEQTKSESISSIQVERASKILRKRITTIRETHGWAHEESLSKLQEIVSFHSKHSETESVIQELKESTVQILSSESSSTRLVSAAAVIASSYIATNQVSKATELSQELYRQVVIKDTSNVKSYKFDLSSKGRQSLIFLAQLEHSLRRGPSTITEILASLTTEYLYFEEFRSQISSKSSSFHAVSVLAARLYHFLLLSNRQAAATRVFNDFVGYFLASEGKRIKSTETAQVKVFILTILDHFHKHQSTNFIRSIGIASNSRVLELLKKKDYDSACDLAIASFNYISAHDIYRTPAIVKFVFTLGIVVTGRTISPQPDQAAQKKLLGASTVIIQEVLRVVSDLKINLAHISLDYLNILIGVVGQQKDYKNLVWLLSSIWNNRNQQINWSPAVTLQLARRYILARYLVGDALKAARLAEDIVYNCRRVNGARHSSTLEMSTLLSQIYTGIAQRYQSEKGGQHMASKYYKKSASVHENLLRIFIDPSLADVEGGLDSSMSIDGSVFELDLADSTVNGNFSDGEHVRQHLQLLKLAVQRLGDWPKDYSEYDHLNAELFSTFKDELQGVEGVEKWNLKSFGSGKAASNEDTLNLEFKSWELEVAQAREENEEVL